MLVFSMIVQKNGFVHRVCSLLVCSVCVQVGLWSTAWGGTFEDFPLLQEYVASYERLHTVQADVLLLARPSGEDDPRPEWHC